MKRNTAWRALSVLLLFSVLFVSCGRREPDGTGTDGTQGSAITDDGKVTEVEVDTTEHDFTFLSQEGEDYTYICADCGKRATLTVTCLSGTAGCAMVEGNTLTLSGMTEDSVYALAGEFYGSLAVSGGEEIKLELELNGLTVHSATECPLRSSGLKKLTVSAKKGTENYLLDLRDGVTDSAEVGSAVWTEQDLDLQGKGDLYVVSLANNGIHSKGDLAVKNLYLRVECEDNALKGNDSVSVASGTLELIARTGDGIKTSNSDLSKKGKQRGTVALTGGDIRIYAACDGIDSAYDLTLDETDAALTLSVFTDRYSPYSEAVTQKETETLYLRTDTDAYRYALYFYGDADGVWRIPTAEKTAGSYRYYATEKPTGYTKLRLYLYTVTQEPGQAEDYYYLWDDITVHESYDTLAVSVGRSLRLGWTSYATAGRPSGGFHGGMGGMNDGNTDKGDHSTKGLKAANAIAVNGGTVTISSYDDCLHASRDGLLENGAEAVGSVTISGGSLMLSSNDDGIHADGAVSVTGGKLSVVQSYEGIEGETVTLSGGEISVVASDDGINATATSGVGITVSGGTLYVLASGDGMDANTKTAYAGILFEGGRSVILSTGRADSALDTEQGYTYRGGYAVAIGLSGGMSAESTHCSPSVSEIGTVKTLSVSGGYLSVEGLVTVRVPTAMNAQIVCLGRTNARISAVTDGDGDALWQIAE